MDINAVDERDIDREDFDPRFRVYFFTPPNGGGSFAVEAFDVTNCDVLEAVAWARHDEDGRSFAVGLVWVASTSPEVGITWLFGGDPNEPSPPRPEWVRRTLEEGA